MKKYPADAGGRGPARCVRLRLRDRVSESEVESNTKDKLADGRRNVRRSTAPRT